MTRVLQMQVEVIYSLPDLQLLASKAPLQTVEAAADSACQIVRKLVRQLPKDRVCSLLVRQRDIEVHEELEEEATDVE